MKILYTITARSGVQIVLKDDLMWYSKDKSLEAIMNRRASANEFKPDQAVPRGFNQASRVMTLLPKGSVCAPPLDDIEL